MGYHSFISGHRHRCFCNDKFYRLIRQGEYWYNFYWISLIKSNKMDSLIQAGLSLFFTIKKKDSYVNGTNYALVRTKRPG